MIQQLAQFCPILQPVMISIHSPGETARPIMLPGGGNPVNEGGRSFPPVAVADALVNILVFGAYAASIDTRHDFYQYNNSPFVFPSLAVQTILPLSARISVE